MNLHFVLRGWLLVVVLFHSYVGLESRWRGGGGGLPPGEKNILPLLEKVLHFITVIIFQKLFQRKKYLLQHASEWLRLHSV